MRQSTVTPAATPAAAAPRISTYEQWLAAKLAAKHGRSAAEMKELIFRLHGDSQQNAEMKLIAGILRVAGAIIATYVSSHPDGCRCRGCYRRVEGTTGMVEQVGVLVEIAANMVEGDVAAPVGLNGETYAEDLRILADLADEEERLWLAERDGNGDPKD